MAESTVPYAPRSMRFGGDYNPEQWPEHVWADDVRLMREAGVNLATVGVFSWARLEPSEGEFDFGWLDRVLDGLHSSGVRVDLATATASPPPWLTANHPEVLPVTVDGIRLAPGSRQAYCPSSPVYRRLARRLVTSLAERYGDHPALDLWHINNEYGCHVPHCYCDVSSAAFQAWLQARYGDIESLNQAWGTAFWSQRYGSFDEVLPPRTAPYHRNPTQLRDFDRFSSDELLACFLSEKEVLREITPQIPVTTNFMGFFRGADYWAWAAHVDIVADDLYPNPADAEAAFGAAAAHDLMRSLAGGRPWLLMEQATSAANFRIQNAVKAPGQMRAWSYQAVARGADGILFFQWRQSLAGAEKFHSGMVPHSGTDTRVFREVTQLGNELAAFEDLVGSTTPAQAAIVFDWASWWALEQEGSSTTTAYLDVVLPWHRALAERGVVVDFAQADETLTRYPLVIVPALYSASDAQLAAIDAAAQAGSTVLITGQSAVLDENLHVRPGGYLGGLQQTLGVWVEEFTPPAARRQHSEVPGLTVQGDTVAGSAHGWAEVVRIRDADVRATFAGGALDGLPALTRRVTGTGASWYLPTRLDEEPLAALIEQLAAEAGVALADPGASGWIEVVRRGDREFIINHGFESVRLERDGVDELTGLPVNGLELAPHGVVVVRDDGISSPRTRR